MHLIDTHSHLYAEEFDTDRNEAIARAIQHGVTSLLLPNVDSSSVEAMMQLAANYPQNCFPMMGLHPTSVKADFRDELAIVEQQLKSNRFIAVGEIGLDLYWDQSFLEEQKTALAQQFDWARQYHLPVVIHLRNAFVEMKDFLETYDLTGITGVFHCFGGTVEEAEYIVSKGFLLGIGGVLTYKKSDLPAVVKAVGLEHLVLETDSPYLAPVPMRGKRNESAYLHHIAQKLADLLEMSVEKVAEATTVNAKRVFKLKD